VLVVPGEALGWGFGGGGGSSFPVAADCVVVDGLVVGVQCVVAALAQEHEFVDVGLALSGCGPWWGVVGLAVLV